MASYQLQYNMHAFTKQSSCSYKVFAAHLYLSCSLKIKVNKIDESFQHLETASLVQRQLLMNMDSLQYRTPQIANDGFYGAIC